MMAFPSMLFDACEKAGIPHPEDDDYIPDEWLRFHLFCLVQLGRPVRWGEHWENAEVIAKVPEDKIKTITLGELIEMGLHVVT